MKPSERIAEVDTGAAGDHNPLWIIGQLLDRLAASVEQCLRLTERERDALHIAMMHVARRRKGNDLMDQARHWLNTDPSAYKTLHPPAGEREGVDDGPKPGPRVITDPAEALKSPAMADALRQATQDELTAAMGVPPNVLDPTPTAQPEWPAWTVERSQGVVTVRRYTSDTKYDWWNQNIHASSEAATSADGLSACLQRGDESIITHAEAIALIPAVAERYPLATQLPPEEIEARASADHEQRQHPSQRVVEKLMGRDGYGNPGVYGVVVEEDRPPSQDKPVQERAREWAEVAVKSSSGNVHLRNHIGKNQTDVMGASGDIIRWLVDLLTAFAAAETQRIKTMFSREVGATTMLRDENAQLRTFAAAETQRADENEAELIKVGQCWEGTVKERDSLRTQLSDLRKRAEASEARVMAVKEVMNG